MVLKAQSDKNIPKHAQSCCQLIQLVDQILS